MTLKMPKAVLCFVLGLLLLLPSLAAAQGVVQNIEVKGAQRIDPNTVLTYLNIAPGQNPSRNELDDALKELFSTGLFSDVTIQQEGSTLVVRVVENPIINQIFFEGNDKIDDAQLYAEIDLREREVLTRTRVQNDLARIGQLYRRNGRFSAQIDPKVVELDQNRVNLVFEISEGDVTKIRSIRFVGNEKFTDRRLRGEISSRQNAWYSFISSADRYDPDRLSFDQELLRRFYLSQGYADIQVVSAIAELATDRDGFFITMTVDEGKRYKVRSVKIDSRLRNFDANVLSESVEIRPNDWYDADEVRATVDRITDQLGDLQYAFVNISPDIKRSKDSAEIDISFVIEESSRVFVERIDIGGNQRTLDRVVRREFLLSEGDPFNRSRLARSEQRIRDLGFFENVTVSPRPGSAPDKTIIDVDVSEQSTGELSLGAGFSTNDGPLVDARIRERNFLGKGQDFLIGATIAGERTQLDLSFTEPYFLGRDISAGFDLFRSVIDFQRESAFNQSRAGGALRLGYPLSERWRQTLRVRGEQNEITDIQQNASTFIREQEGERITLAVSQTLGYSSLNSNLFPTDGVRYWLTTEFAGFGGDAQYVSARTGASYFYEVFDDVVFNLLGEVGAIEGYGDTPVAINERFFLGGVNNFRGFQQLGVGPRDQVTDDSLGGNRFYRGTAEFSFPLGLAEDLGIRGHAFTDIGSLFEIDTINQGLLNDEASLRASAGVGLSWVSPFGPIRLDFAQPVISEEFDRDEVIQFNFGTRF